MEDILKLQKNLRNIITSHFLEQYVIVSYWEGWCGSERKIKIRTEVSSKFRRSKAKTIHKYDSFSKYKGCCVGLCETGTSILNFACLFCFFICSCCAGDHVLESRRCSRFISPCRISSEYMQLNKL